MQDADPYDPQQFVAKPWLEGDKTVVRIIRLSPGQSLPPHTHATSDLMLYAVEGQGELDTPTGPQPFGAGSLAFFRGEEELRVRNAGRDGVTLLAFLSPKFPPA